MNCLFEKNATNGKKHHIGVALLTIAVSLLLALSGCSAGKKAVQPTVMFNAGSPITSGAFRCLAVADFNNDNRLDLAGGSSQPGGVSIWYQEKNANFFKPFTLPFKADVRSIAAADINRDGREDIVCSVQRESSGIAVWLNEGSGQWRKGDSPSKINKYEGIELADINHDGHYDIVAANSTAHAHGGVQVWLGDGHGGWATESGPTVTGIYHDVKTGDFNNDGALDIAAAGWGTYGTIKIWLGDAKGEWSSGYSLENGSYYTLTLSDVNHDGNLDILAGTYRAGIKIFLGDGQGWFEKIDSPSTTGSFWKILAVDINDDTHVDFIATSVESRGITCWRNTGRQSWLPAKVRFPPEGTYYDIATAKLAEGKSKILLATSKGEGVSLFSLQPDKQASIIGDKFGGSVTAEVINIDEEAQENDVFIINADGTPEYKIGVRDVLSIDIWDIDGIRTEEIIVKPNGKISFDFIKNMTVAGMTPSAVENLLREQLSTYIKDPQIDVAIDRYQSKFVTIMGPGSDTALDRETGGGKIYLKGKTNVLEILAGGGLLAETADLKNITIRRRDGGKVIKVNLYKAVTLGDKTQNPILNHKDLIYVPRLSQDSASRVYVLGEVRKPGTYSFTRANMPIFDAISRAGGFTIYGLPEQTRIIRGDITEPEIVSVNVEALMEEGDHSQNIQLADGDIVYVPQSAIGSVNEFIEKIRPIVNLITLPARSVDDLPTNDNLRID